MTITSLPDILKNQKASGGTLAQISPGWSQGRAVYGGVAASVALTAMEGLLSAPKPLRSLMVNFVAPMTEGEAACEARILREGRSVTQTSVDVHSPGQLAVHASAAFGAPRETKSVAAGAAFTPESRTSVPPLDMARAKLPGFLERFDIHWTGGGVPMSGAEDKRLGMWVRHRDDMAAFPAAKIVALADIPPPVMMSHYTRPVMASSLSWSLEFVCPAAEIKSDWFYLDYTLEAAADGYSQQNGRIFSEDGTLAALSRQCMVYFE